MPKYNVAGVDRESEMDTSLVIDAPSPENAKVKGELKGMVVTGVKEIGAPAPAPAPKPHVQPPPPQGDWPQNQLRSSKPKGLHTRIVPEAKTVEGQVAMGIGRALFWIVALFFIFGLLMAIVGAGK